MAVSQGEIEELRTRLDRVTESLESSQKQNAVLQRNLDSANENYEENERRYQATFKEKQDLQRTVIKLAREMKELETSLEKNEQYIRGVEDESSRVVDELDETKTALKRSQELLEQTRALEKSAKNHADELKKQLDGAVRDSKGLSVKCSQLEKAGSEARSKLEHLQIQALIYRDAADDIKLERERNKILVSEMNKLREDIDNMGFNPDASALNKNPVQTPHKSLDQELAEATDSASEAESEDEIEPEAGSSTPQASKPAIKEVVKEVVNEVTKEVIKEIEVVKEVPVEVIKEIEVIKEVPVTHKVEVVREVAVLEKVFIDRPFQISDHHPFICWFQVELNFITLFYAFITTLFSVITRTTRKIPGVPAAKESIKPTLSNSTSGETTPTNEAGNMSLSADTTLVAGDIEDSFDLTAKSQESATSNGEQPAQTDAQLVRPSTWKLTTITKPKKMPVALPTIAAFAFHLIVYATPLFIWAAYTERQMWIDANDSARIAINQLRHNPEYFRSGVSKILFMLSEEWKAAIDLFLFDNVVAGSSMTINQPMPG